MLNKADQANNYLLWLLASCYSLKVKKIKGETCNEEF